MCRALAHVIVAGVVLLAPVLASADSARSSRATRSAPRPPAVETAEPAVATPSPTPAAAATGAPAAPTPPAAPAPTVPPPSFTGAGGTLLLGSLLLVGLLYAAARLVRRMPIARFLPSADGSIRIASRTHLGARESLCLVDVGTTTLLLAVTGQSIQTLHVWPEGIRTAPASPPFAGPGAAPPVPGQLRALAARLSGGR